MARFIFKLQKILNIKLKLEAQTKVEFSNAVNKLRAEEEKLAKIYDEISVYQEKIREQNENVLNLNELRYCTQAIEFKKKQADIQKKQIKIAERNLERARTKLNEAMVERKMYEALREKAFNEFLSEINAQEKQEIDELVSYQYSTRA